MHHSSQNLPQTLNGDLEPDCDTIGKETKKH